jgi:hypothetical protein
MQCNASSTVRTTRHRRRSFFAGCHAAAGLPWSQTSAVSGGVGPPPRVHSRASQASAGRTAGQ